MKIVVVDPTKVEALPKRTRLGMVTSLLGATCAMHTEHSIRGTSIKSIESAMKHPCTDSQLRFKRSNRIQAHWEAMREKPMR